MSEKRLHCEECGSLVDVVFNLDMNGSVSETSESVGKCPACESLLLSGEYIIPTSNSVTVAMGFKEIYNKVRNVSVLHPEYVIKNAAD